MALDIIIVNEPGAHDPHFPPSSLSPRPPTKPSLHCPSNERENRLLVVVVVFFFYLVLILWMGTQEVLDHRQVSFRQVERKRYSWESNRQPLRLVLGT
jgi:hypothetical protein